MQGGQVWPPQGFYPRGPKRNALHFVVFVAWQVPVCTLSAVQPAPVKTSFCSQNESPEFGREPIVAASCMTFKSHLLLMLHFWEIHVLEFELSLFAGVSRLFRNMDPRLTASFGAIPIRF